MLNKSTVNPPFQPGVGAVMDLGAFLQTGKKYPVLIQSVENKCGSIPQPQQAYVCCSEDKIIWGCQTSRSKGEEVLLNIEINGFELTNDGSLKKNKDASTSVVIAARVISCHADGSSDRYLLDLDILGRILP